MEILQSILVFVLVIIGLMIANAWLHKNELERKYLQSLIDEQKKNGRKNGIL